jgi:hypothetical protein
LTKYAEDGVDIAWEVLADTAKMAQVAALKAEGASAEDVATFIDGAFIEKAQEAQERAEEAARRERKARSAEAEERERAERLKGDWQVEQERRKGVESDLERERRLREEEKTELTGRIETLEQSAADRESAEREKRIALERSVQRDKERRARKWRLALATLLGVAAVAATALLIALHAVDGKIATLVVVLGGVLLLAVAISVALGEKWAGRLFTHAGILLGVAGLLVPLLFTGGDR